MFRINAKNFFLTYARCELDKTYVLTKLQELLQDKEVIYIRVAHELHADEGHHLHCLVQLRDRFNCRDASYFDIDGHHPNVQAPRQPADVNSYIEKDGDIVDFGEFVGTKKHTWADCIGQPTADAFMGMVMENYPRDYALSYERLEYFTRKHYKAELPVYNPDPNDVFTITPEMENWVDLELNKVSFQGETPCTPRRSGYRSLPLRSLPPPPPFRGS